MEKEQIKNIIEKIDFSELAEEILVRDFGQTVHVFADGSINVLNSNEYFYCDDVEEIAFFKCPGIGNLDTTFFTEQFCAWDEEKEAYVTNTEYDSGREVGDIIDVIRECIQDGDMTVFYEDWERQIEEQIIDAERDRELGYR